MIIPTYYPVIGGTQKQVEWLSQRLLAKGQSVHVLTRQHTYAHPNRLPASDVVNDAPVRRLYSRGWGNVGSLLYMLGGWWYLLRHGRRDIYHAQALGAAGWLAVVARYLLGGRCVIKMRTGSNRYQKSYASGLARWQFATLLRLADRVQVVNGEVERLVENLGIPAERVIRLPNAVDTKAFHPSSPEEKVATRKRLGLPLKKNILLWVGRLHQVKGLDILLRAWALLPPEMGDQALLVLVGDGSEQAKLLELIKQLELTESVRLVGAQRAVRDYYWAADIFVLPSRSEGLSGALVEAMACGLPIIASNVGGAPDVIEEGRNGALFESEDHDQLARKLAAMMAVPDRWDEMGMQARNSVMEYADLDVVVDRLRNLYRELI